MAERPDAPVIVIGGGAGGSTAVNLLAWLAQADN